MGKDLIHITEKEILESSKRAILEGSIFTDMSDYYSNKTYEILSQNNPEMKERILGMDTFEEDTPEIIAGPIRTKNL